MRTYTIKGFTLQVVGAEVLYRNFLVGTMNSKVDRILEACCMIDKHLPS